MLYKVMDLRAYAKAKQQFEAGKAEQDVSKRPQGPLIERVASIAIELAKEELARRMKQT